MESFLKDYLDPKEVIHHINGIKDDNKLSNLMIFKNCAYHTHHHKKLNKMKDINNSLKKWI